MTFWDYVHEHTFMVTLLGLAWAVAIGSFGPLVQVDNRRVTKASKETETK
jgi:hypothetical protein